MVLVASKPSMAIGTIKLQTNAALLDAVEVTARQAQVEMKADTFVYNAGAYRVPEGSALEELVKEIAGGGSFRGRNHHHQRKGSEENHDRRQGILR